MEAMVQVPAVAGRLELVRFPALSTATHSDTVGQVTLDQLGVRAAARDRVVDVRRRP